MEGSAKARAVWNSAGGSYDRISRTIADAIGHAVERLAPHPGEHVLDLATGTGWASRVVAERCPGATVTGVDIAEEMLEFARVAASRQELTISYRQADAEALPFADASIDATVSTFGVMFVSRPDVAAAELARVVKPGGRAVLATWREDGNVAAMFGVMRPFMAAAPSSSPFAWGRRERVRELLGDAFDLAFEDGTNVFRYASGEQAWQLWAHHYGPAKALAASLDDAQRERLQRAMIEWHESFASSLGYAQPRSYLITHAVRKH